MTDIKEQSSSIIHTPEIHTKIIGSILLPPILVEPIIILKIIKERLNLSLPRDVVSYLRELSEKNHRSVTASIIDIILFYKMIHEFSQNGYKISLEDGSGKNNYLLMSTLV